MKNGKKLNSTMRKLMTAHGFNYENYLYTKNTSTETVFVHKDGSQTITIKRTGEVVVKGEWPEAPSCQTCRYITHDVTGHYCKHPRLKESVASYENRINKKVNKFISFIGLKVPKTTIRYCPYKELKRTQEGREKK